MRCRKVKKLLGPFMDDELPEGQSLEVLSHLEGCAGCQDELESLMALESLGQDLPAPEPGEDYWETFLPRLRARFAEEERRPARVGIREALSRLFTPPAPWVRLAGAVATAVLIFFVGRAVYQHEVRMRGIRALPKRLLTDQARQAEEANRADKSALEKVTEDFAQEHESLSEEGLAGAGMAVPGHEEAPSPPSDKRLPETAAAMRPKKDDRISPIPVPSSEIVPADEDLAGTPKLDSGERKISGLSATSEDAFERATSKGARSEASDPHHWRDQIQTWQDRIEGNPRDERLGEIYLRLADSWFQLARLTEEEDDLRRALQAQRVALDFAEEEPSRQLLHERIHLLEEWLQKK